MNRLTLWVCAAVMFIMLGYGWAASSYLQRIHKLEKGCKIQWVRMK